MSLRRLVPKLKCSRVYLYSSWYLTESAYSKFFSKIRAFICVRLRCRSGAARCWVALAHTLVALPLPSPLWANGTSSTNRMYITSYCNGAHRATDTGHRIQKSWWRYVMWFPRYTTDRQTDRQTERWSPYFASNWCHYLPFCEVKW